MSTNGIDMIDAINITLNTAKLSTLLRSNISCYIDKPLTYQLIDILTEQIIDSIDYFINKKDTNI